MNNESSLHIEEIDMDDPLWDHYVNVIAGGHVYYQRAYLTAFQKLNEYNPTMFVYRNGEERAINVCYRRDIALDNFFKGRIDRGRYYDLMSPYGYGGYIGSVIDHETLMGGHHEYCEKKGYISEVIKFHPLLASISCYCGELESNFHNVICDLTPTMDEIWKGFKSKVRKNVKRAESYGLETIIDDTGEYLDQFVEIYYATMKRNEAGDGYYFPKEFFETLNCLKDQIVYIHILYKGKVISTELILYDNNYCYSYLGGTDADFYYMRPNDLLKYEVIRWGKKKGLRGFVLGGGHGDDDGIFQYKLALAPRGMYDFHVGTDVFLRGEYEELCEIRKKDDPSFRECDRMRPAYRF